MTAPHISLVSRGHMIWAIVSWLAQSLCQWNKKIKSKSDLLFCTFCILHLDSAWYLHAVVILVAHRLMQYHFWPQCGLQWQSGAVLTCLLNEQKKQISVVYEGRKDAIQCYLWRTHLFIYLWEPDNLLHGHRSFCFTSKLLARYAVSQM